MALRCDTVQQRAMIRRKEACDTAGHALRHDRACTASRPGQAYDTAQGAHKVRAGWARCAPGAPNLVLDSVHCF